MANSQAIIVITTSHIWFSCFQELCSPVIEIDGEPHKGVWGINSFCVTAGQHEVTAYHRWAVFAHAYKSSVSVDVRDGEVLRLDWRTGWYVKSPGRWTASSRNGVADVLPGHTGASTNPTSRNA